MAEEIRRIPFEEFSNNIKAFVIEKEPGEIVVVKPYRGSRKVDARRTEKTEVDYETFRSAAGSWDDVDTDTFIKNAYESRHNSSRPPVHF